MFLQGSVSQIVSACYCWSVCHPIPHPQGQQCPVAAVVAIGRTFCLCSFCLMWAPSPTFLNLPLLLHSAIFSATFSHFLLSITASGPSGPGSAPGSFSGVPGNSSQSSLFGPGGSGPQTSLFGAGGGAPNVSNVSGGPGMMGPGLGLQGGGPGLSSQSSFGYPGVGMSGVSQTSGAGRCSSRSWTACWWFFFACSVSFGLVRAAAFLTRPSLSGFTFSGPLLDSRGMLMCFCTPILPNPLGRGVGPICIGYSFRPVFFWRHFCCF